MERDGKVQRHGSGSLAGRGGGQMLSDMPVNVLNAGAKLNNKPLFHKFTGLRFSYWGEGEKGVEGGGYICSLIEVSKGSYNIVTHGHRGAQPEPLPPYRSPIRGGATVLITFYYFESCAERKAGWEQKPMR